MPFRRPSAPLCDDVLGALSVPLRVVYPKILGNNLFHCFSIRLAVLYHGEGVAAMFCKIGRKWQISSNQSIYPVFKCRTCSRQARSLRPVRRQVVHLGNDTGALFSFPWVDHLRIQMQQCKRFAQRNGTHRADLSSTLSASCGQRCRVGGLYTTSKLRAARKKKAIMPISRFTLIEECGDRFIRVSSPFPVAGRQTAGWSELLEVLPIAGQSPRRRAIGASGDPKACLR